MDFLSDIINQSQYEYIGPLVFGGFLLIGVVIGFINGFKASLFFLVLNIISIIATVLILNHREEIADRFIPESFKIGGFKVKDLLSDGLSKTVEDNPELTTVIPENFKNENIGFKGIYNIFSAIIPIFIYVILNTFVFLPIYFIFRGRLKDGIFKSKIVSRIGGAIISLITVFPFAVIAGAIAASIGDTSSNFSKFISELTNIISLGKIKNIPESMNDLKTLIKYLI